MRSVVRTLGLQTALGIAALSCSAQACPQSLAQEPDGPGERAAELSFEPASLRSAIRRTLVEGVTSAENQLFTSTGRLFVSGDQGIFEIIRSPGGTYQSQPLHTGESCFFGGLTEQAGTIYANCYDSSDASLFAARLTDQPDFRPIYRLSGVALANGLTTDGAGSLFLASSLEGRIIHLRVAANDPLSIVSEDTFDGLSGFLTNGLKYFDEKLYWSAFTTVYVAPVRTDGQSGRRRTLGSAFTFFDDLYVDQDGLLIADFLNGSIVACDPSGKVQGATPNALLEGPSSVQRANGRLGLPDGALVITERTANRVSVLEL
jgi:hypothetical protein